MIHSNVIKYNCRFGSVDRAMIISFKKILDLKLCRSNTP